MYDVIDTVKACLGLGGFLLHDAEVVAGSDGKIRTGLERLVPIQLAPFQA
jgi:hypothetical protein